MSAMKTLVKMRNGADFDCWAQRVKVREGEVVIEWDGRRWAVPMDRVEYVETEVFENRNRKANQ